MIVYITVETVQYVVKTELFFLSKEDDRRYLLHLTIQILTRTPGLRIGNEERLESPERVRIV